ncbi:MAG: hypothetical protein F9K40_19260 [Kofleriaceae bacterium]|nr:MAG: hypothetical protein F9K40_19260 [Kofleriaceae bacterium]
MSASSSPEARLLTRGNVTLEPRTRSGKGRSPWFWRSDGEPFQPRWQTAPYDVPVKDSLKAKLDEAARKQHPVLVLSREDYDAGDRIPEEIARVTNLHAISAFGASNIPDSVGELVGLDSLSVWEGSVAHVPATIGSLVNLRTLELKGNKRIATLPDSIAHLGKLELLDVGSNALEVLPEAVGELTALRTLVVSYNPLARLPSTLGELAQLRELYAHSCQLTAFPDVELRALSRLVLAFNRLRTFPISVCRCTALRDLDIGKNAIPELPDEIAQLTSLEELHLWSNPLKVLPEALRRLPRLRELGVDPGRKWPKDLRKEISARRKRFRRDNPDVVHD